MIRDHERAARAHADVTQVKTDAKAGRGKDYADTYGALCHKLPILIHQGGLAAALHFVAARGKDGQRVLLAHLAGQLGQGKLLTDKATDQDLLAAVRSADLPRLQALTREVQRCMLWYKRFAATELEVDADAGGD